ncbi:MAG: S-layer homology domain-containing protein, partial [Oscillospiraceae bacterium]|nr:S-layer homology domain-containing protein [Oscillospiraceae bacterium]
GEVSTTSGAAVGASGDTATITVSGGSVSATTGSAIAASSNSTVTVTGGSVSATTGNAITAYGASSTVTVSGGLVFAYGSDIIGDGNVVYVRDNPSGFTDASGTGVVIAWNQGASNTHASGSETDITLAPDTGAAVWATREGQNGIAYTNGDNEGFIPLSDVTVKPALTGTVTITGTPAYGKTLTAVTGGLTVEPGNSGVTDLGDLSYQWKRSDTEISDATEQTYTLVSEDVGKTITATVTAENCLESVTSAPTTVLDLSALEAKLAEAKAIKRGNYITSTWDALQEAIAGAETTLETEAQHVTQEAIDAALDALISAIDGLRHIYLLPPDSNNNDENDDAVEPPEPSEEPEENPFDDVGQNDWFYEDVMFAYRRGLMTGTSARKFSPDAPMARGMIVTVLHRMESEPAARGATTFSDVADGKYYTEAVAWAEAEGIVDGYGNGLFGPEEDITRQDLALLFLRYARYKGLTLPAIRQYTAFIDDADVSDYAREAARTLYRAGIISGKPGSRLDPKGTATRAEVAAMLLRFLESVQQ